ncbi:uncharacterized protein K02A2.6-like [Armigeres subalbatus]|uniref:uncharacterized protein K02A2.6-like n=1 Tax=Armigeres subalbatus TaxID=124917 RepID=UPI002ED0EE65
MWEAWNRYIENFEIAATLNNANDPVRRSQLLFLSVGEELQGIIRAAKLRPSLTDANCYHSFVNNIKNYLQSMTDSAAEHEAFSNMKQENAESAIAFHARLMAPKGLRNKELVKAARTYGYDTKYVVQAATRDEAYQAETTASESPEVYTVSRRTPHSQSQGQSRNDNQRRRRTYPWDRRYTAKQPRVDEQGFRRETNNRGYRSRCPRCNQNPHNNYPCPALKRKCNSCREFGHYAIVCRKRAVQHLEMANDESPKQENAFHDNQHVNTLSLEDVLVNCQLGKSAPIKFLVDSGADANVIGGAEWILLQKQLEQGNTNINVLENVGSKGLHAYGTTSPMVVECLLEAKVTVVGSASRPQVATFHVVPKGRRSLLGRSTASDLGLLQVGLNLHNVETSKPEKFPKMPGVKIRFSVDKAVPPVKNAYYNVPAAYRVAAKQRLEEMEKSGIIEKVTSAPNWISGMSAVAKGKDDFRLVVNMRAPNKAINREYFRLPLLEEMKVKLHGSKCFTKLDLSNAFYHLELSKESRDLTTFITESGMYRFTRLMFGVNCAPEVFQREMTRILENVENIIVYIDDILIFASNFEELHKTVNQVLQILRANNLTLNAKKCEFDKTQLKFLGHQLDAEGFHVDEEKIRSIRQFREPATISELRSFLGLASFISAHVKNFADITSPLWTITTAKSWTWGYEQSQAFQLIKEKILQNCVTLGYFSENDRTILYTDASPIALGAVLVQNNKDGSSRIISYASKSLTTTERRYAQNQREALAAVWAVEHFSYFLLGRKFTLRTDAQGVSFILNRSREESKRALTRADGWALRLSPYRYDVEYIRGADNIADPPSRLYNGNDVAFDDDTSPWEIASLEANSVGFLTDEEIKAATFEDPILQNVMCSLKSGKWPLHLRQFQLVESDLTTRDQILVKTGCVVIPTALRRKTLDLAHHGHPSAAKLKSILRQRVWWPGMAAEAQQLVETCETCAVNGKPEKPTPMQRIFAPRAVWETIALDFNGPYVKFGEVYILVIVDYRSRYLIARPVKSTGFMHTRKVLEDIFDREGIPKSIKTDNGPPFNGEDYKTTVPSVEYQRFSRPLFPQQNGLVEGYMKVINKAMVSATVNKTNYVEELREAIHAHNAAAHSVTRLPPEEVMSGRKIKRKLPLLEYEKVSIDEELLNDRDREVKLASKSGRTNDVELASAESNLAIK